MRFRRRYEVIVQGESGSAVSQLSVISEHRTEREAREAAALERRRLEMIRAEEAASWVISVVRGDEVLHEERPFDGRRESAPVPPVSSLGLSQHETPAGDTADAPTAAAPWRDRAPDSEADAGTADDDAGSTGTMPAVTGTGETTAQPPTSAPAGDPEDEDEDGATASHPRPRPPAETAEPSPDERPERPAGPPADTDDDATEGPFAMPAGVDVADEGAAMPGFLAEREPARRRGEGDIPSGPVPEDVIRRFEEAIARERARERNRAPRSDR